MGVEVELLGEAGEAGEVEAEVGVEVRSYLWRLLRKRRAMAANENGVVTAVEELAEEANLSGVRTVLDCTHAHVHHVTHLCAHRVTELDCGGVQ